MEARLLPCGERAVLVEVSDLDAVLALGAAGLLVGGFFAYRGKSLTAVAVVSCLTALAVEGLLILLA